MDGLSRNDFILFIIKRTSEELDEGTWADITRIYNTLANAKRTQDGLQSQYRIVKGKMKAKEESELVRRTQAVSRT